MLRKRKHPEAIGIHVSSGSLTIVRVMRLPEATRILELFSEPLVRQRGEWPVAVVAERLGRARKDVNLSSERVGMTVSSDLAVTKFLDMPRLGNQQLAEAVGLRLEQEWGAGSQFSFQYEILETYRERFRVLAVSMPMPTVKLIVGSFLDARCKVDALDVDSVALTNLLARFGLVGSAPVAVLDLGPRWSEIHIIKGRKLALSRPIVKLNKDAGQDGSEEEQAAEGGAKTGEGGGSSASPQLAWVAREANRTLDYFEIELLSPPVEKVVLIGECTQAPDVAGLFEEEMKLTASVLTLEDRVDDQTGRFSSALHSPAVAAAMHEEVAGEG